MTDRKFCKDCKHVRRFWLDFGGYDLARCNHPKLIDVAALERPFVRVERNSDLPKSCGPSGRLWEPKK
jgi:hypothetical protein